MRPFAMFARRVYTQKDGKDALVKAINVILFKLEGQAMLRHPEYKMEDRLLFDKIDPAAGTVRLPYGEFALNTVDFPTYDPQDPYRLSPEEEQIVTEWQKDFRNSANLQRHMRFLFTNGALYCRMNGNLMFHGGVPLHEDGSFRAITLRGKTLQGLSLIHI